MLAALKFDTDIAFVAGERRWSLSDAGAAAVLLKMDEFQGRLDTTGALVRKGKRGEAKVLPALPAPVVAHVPLRLVEDPQLAADPGLVRAIRQATPRDDCDLPDHVDAAMRALTVRRIDDDRLVVSSLCWTAAYNTGDAYWLVDAAPPHAATLVTISGTDWDNGVITATQKGRGIGDCFSTDSWTWDGTAFVHTSSETTGLCKGFLGGAWSLPTLVTKVQSDTSDLPEQLPVGGP
jgi:hypothetical protein